MATGMEMLLGAVSKQLGIKPEEIKNKIEEFQKNILVLLTNINNRLGAIEKTQAEIREQLQWMKQGQQEPPQLSQLQPPQVPPPPQNHSPQGPPQSHQPPQ